MKFPLFPVIGLSLPALGIGIVSGLPFRPGTRASAAMATPAADTRLRDPFGREIPRPKSATERALGIVTTRDPAALGQAFERALPGARAGSPVELAMIREIAARWAGVDPRGMFDHLMGTDALHRTASGDNHLPDFCRILFDSWVAGDPDAATAAALELDRHPRSSSDEGLAILMAFLIPRDPERALRLGQAHPTAVLESLGNPPADTLAPHACVDFLARLHPSPLQEQSLASGFLRWSADPRQRAEAWNWLRSRPDALGLLARHSHVPPLDSPLPSDLLGAMRDHVERNPAAAASFVRSRGAELVATYGFRETIAWATDQLKGVARHDSLRLLFEHSGEIGDELFLDAYSALPSSPLRDQVAADFAGRTALGDPEGTLEWLDAQNLTKGARARAVDRWAMELTGNPDVMLRFLNNRPPDELSAHLIERFFVFAARFNPREGLARLQTLADEDQALAATRILFGNWPYTEGMEAPSEAAQSLPQPALRRAALDALEAIAGEQAPEE